MLLPRATMTQRAPQSSHGRLPLNPDAGLDESGAPRKKLRKGTTSCWECKRRKVRCIFTPSRSAGFTVSESSTCDGCKRRGTACVGQEYPDVPSPAPNNPRPSEERLGRVEALVEQLIKRSDIATPPDSLQETEASPSVYAASEHGGRLAQSVPSRTSFRPGVPQRPAPRISEKYDAVSQELLAVWPTPQELDFILNAHDPVGSAGLLRKLTSYTLHPNFSREHVPSPAARDLLVLPPSGSHPVTIARKLLLLGIFLQYLRPCVRERQASQQSDNVDQYHDIMVRVMDTASRLVTSNDELVGSVEGVECLMLESLYKDTAGSIRRSWVATRRAMAIAQMMGLHRGRAKILEPETRARFDPGYMWFRLVQSDRYLSLMLGLPLGYAENTFAGAKALHGCEPWERLRRLDTVASGRIIQRNDADQEVSSAELCFAKTRDIDRLLQEASDNMPPNWWVVDDILTTDSRGRASLSDEDTMRLMDQIAHYNLVVQLHLPFLLRPGLDGIFDYNKMTAVNASREVLRRFVLFRKAYPVGTYCRGVDFLAFIATAALCLAHMEGRRQQHHGHSKPGGQGTESTAMGTSNILLSLTHQRQTDRGLMERTAESLHHMGASTADVLAAKLSALLRHLLVIEQDSATDTGSYYSADLSPEAEYHDNEHGQQEVEEGPAGCNGNISQGGNVLQIYIPYYGTVKIEKRRGVSKSNIPLSAGQFGQVGTGGGQLETTEQQPIAQSSDDTALLDGELFAGTDGFPYLDPELAAGPEEWILQGVDMAFFDSLMRGMTDAGHNQGGNSRSAEW